MATQLTQSHFRLPRNARNWGLSALIAATIGGVGLTQRAAASSATPPTQDTPTTGIYQDGEYTGDSVRAGRWGNVQVAVVIENGAITDFDILDYPHHRSTSNRISHVAIPYLMEETIQAQSADIDAVTGATPTSHAFIESLQSALDDAMAAASTSGASTSTTGSNL